MKQRSLFEKVIIKGTLSAIYGIIAGLMLGIVIWGLGSLVVFLKNILIDGAGSYQNALNNIPIDQVTMLGMCFGAIIGSVTGVVTAFREDKNQKTGRTK